MLTSNPLPPISGTSPTEEYHVNETEECFFQLKGSITIKIVEETTFSPERRPTRKEGLAVFGVTGGEFRDIVVGEGEMFLLPGGSFVLGLGSGKGSVGS